MVNWKTATGSLSPSRADTDGIRTPRLHAERGLVGHEPPPYEHAGRAASTLAVCVERAAGDDRRVRCAGAHLGPAQHARAR